MSRADAAQRLTTIRALLAQAEATPYPAEAEAFTAKAAELMARHAIDEALLWAEDHADAPTEVRVELHRPFVAQKAVLVASVARAFRCRAIRLGRPTGAPTESVAVVGFRADLDLVELLVTSLLVQLTTAMTATPAAGRTAAQVASWRRSFIMGFTNAVDARLRADAARAAATSGSAASGGPGTGGSAGAAPTGSTALVLADRSGAVGDEYRRRYPHVRSSSISAGASAHGHRAGTAAGRAADLGTTRLGGRRALDAGRRGG